MTEEPILSICIGTYNHLNTLKPMIDELLQIKDNRFEIVVSDNVSTDGTWKYLTEIEDKRLNIIRNKYNIGMSPNWLKALSFGRGKYLFHLNDKELVYSSGILYLIDRLSQEDSGFIHVARGKVSVKEERYTTTEESFIRFAYKPGHPSGIIIRKKEFIEIKNSDLKKYFSKDNLYPYAFLIANIIALNGKTAAYNIKLWDFLPMPQLADIKSYTKCEMEEDAWFSPNSRVKYLERMVQDCIKLDVRLSLEDRILNMYKYTLYLAVTRYKNVRNDRELMSHSGFLPLKIGFLKQIRICFFVYYEFTKWFRRNYNNKIKKKSFWIKLKTETAKYIWRVCKDVLKGARI